MATIKFETKVDETAAGAIPQLRPLLGQDVVVAVSARGDDEPELPSRITLDDFLRKHRLRRPADVSSVSLEDMERAIGLGAVGGDI